MKGRKKRTPVTKAEADIIEMFGSRAAFCAAVGIGDRTLTNWLAEPERFTCAAVIDALMAKGRNLCEAAEIVKGWCG